MEEREQERALVENVEKQFNESVQEVKTPDPEQFAPKTRVRGNKTKKLSNETFQIRSKGKAVRDKPFWARGSDEAIDSDEQRSNVKEKPAWVRGDNEVINLDKKLTAQEKRNLKEEEEWIPVKGSKVAAAPTSRVLRSRTRALAQSADTPDTSQAEAEDAVPMSSIGTGPSLTPVHQCSATHTTTTTTTAVSSAKDNITTVNKRRGEVWITKTEGNNLLLQSQSSRV